MIRAPPPPSFPLLSLPPLSRSTSPPSPSSPLPPKPPKLPPLLKPSQTPPKTFNSPLPPPPPPPEYDIHPHPCSPRNDFHPLTHPKSSLDVNHSTPSFSPSVLSTADDYASAPRFSIMDVPYHGSHSATLFSPSRPRRADTSLPQTSPYSTEGEFTFEMAPQQSARDEFEEEFLNRNRNSDKEDMAINRHLDEVDFRQLEDDEEILSDDASDLCRGDAAARKMNRALSQGLESVESRRERQNTIWTYWKRIPSEVGCESCEGCARLCAENRRLRRQLDELEFELASGVLHNPTDGFESPQVAKAPISPQIPSTMRKKKGWAARFRNLSSASISSNKPGEKARLKSEVQALNVTTKYLWRKLNKAEAELRDYRLQDLRYRMKMNGN